MLDNQDFVVIKSQTKRAKELLPLKIKELKRQSKELLKIENQRVRQEAKVAKLGKDIEYYKLMSGYEDVEVKIKAYAERKNNGKKANRATR